jgi:hypothetical protein
MYTTKKFYRYMDPKVLHPNICNQQQDTTTLLSTYKFAACIRIYSHVRTIICDYWVSNYYLNHFDHFPALEATFYRSHSIIECIQQGNMNSDIRAIRFSYIFIPKRQKKQDYVITVL